jgi:hypothetical protein
VATNPPAVPFLPDWLYRVLFHQPQVGLSELAPPRSAMVQSVPRLSHMSTLAVADTFGALDESTGRNVPASPRHRVSPKPEYGVDEETRAIAA